MLRISDVVDRGDEGSACEGNCRSFASLRMTTRCGVFGYGLLVRPPGQSIIGRARAARPERLVIERGDTKNRADFFVEMMEGFEVGDSDRESLIAVQPELLITAVFQAAIESADG